MLLVWKAGTDDRERIMQKTRERKIAKSVKPMTAMIELTFRAVI